MKTIKILLGVLQASYESMNHTFDAFLSQISSTHAGSYFIDNFS